MFPRIDKQISEKYYDEYVYEIAEKSNAEEIGWHPHIFDNNGQQITDDCELVDNLNSLYEYEIVKNLNLVRIGACQGSNAIYEWLSNKFEISSTAMAGCFREDGLRYYDWENMDGNPYNPSTVDYKYCGDNNYDLLEIPISTMLIKTIYDKYPVRRIINPSYRRDIFRKHLNESLDQISQLEIVVMALHAEELIDGYTNDLYQYGIKNCLDNIAFFENLLNPQYVTLQEFKNRRAALFTKKNLY